MRRKKLAQRDRRGRQAGEDLLSHVDRHSSCGNSDWERKEVVALIVKMLTVVIYQHRRSNSFRIAEW